MVYLMLTQCGMCLPGKKTLDFLNVFTSATCTLYMYLYCSDRFTSVVTSGINLKYVPIYVESRV